MRTIAAEFWLDEGGFVVSAELVLIGTILVLGVIVGLSSLQSAIVFELNDLALAFGSLNQSFFIPGTVGCSNRGGLGGFGGFGCFPRTSGSVFVDFRNSANCLAFNTCGFVGGATGLGASGFSDVSFGIGAASLGGTASTPCPPNSPCPPNATCPPNTPCPPGTIPGNVTPPGSGGPVPMGIPGTGAPPPAAPLPPTSR